MNYLLGKVVSSNELQLFVELNLFSMGDRAYFGSIIKLLEYISRQDKNIKRMYYFHPDKFEIVFGQLKLGDQHRHLLIKDIKTIEFFEKLKGKIFLSQELIKMADKTLEPESIIKREVRNFLKTFEGVRVSADRSSRKIRDCCSRE